MVYSDSTSLLAVGWFISIFVMIYAAYRANWRSFLQYAGVQHFFAGSILVLSAFWLMHAGIKPGLHFHVLGLTAATLLMGWRFSLLAGALVVIVMAGFGKIRIAEIGLTYCLVVTIPVLFTYSLYLLIQRHLPQNPFVYILVAGFLNAGLTQAVHALTVSSVYLWDGIYTTKGLWLDYLRFLPLMMFPEGIINGMFLAGMVSFNPQWLSTFDEDSYFN